MSKRTRRDLRTTLTFGADTLFPFVLSMTPFFPLMTVRAVYGEAIVLVLTKALDCNTGDGVMDYGASDGVVEKSRG